MERKTKKPLADQEYMKQVAQRALKLLKKSPHPEVLMKWADLRLLQEGLENGSPEEKGLEAWVSHVLAQNLYLRDNIHWVREHNSHPEKAETFEDLILAFIPTEGGL